MSNFLQKIADRARERPEQVQFTLIENGAAVPCTLGKIMSSASRYAAAFRSAGIQPRQVILISLKPGIELYHAFLGALQAGCIPSMMPFPSSKQDPLYFWKCHDELFHHLGKCLIVTYSENVTALLEHISSNLLTVLTAEYCASSEMDVGPVQAWDQNEICVLQHSSGTTGLKKGVPLTSAAIELQVASYSKAIELQPEDVIVSWLPLYHDMGFVTALLLPLITGNHVVMMSPFLWLLSPLSIFDAIEEFGASYVWLPNFAFNHLVNSSEGARPRDLSKMKAFVNCSEPCKATTFEKFLDRFFDWGVRQDQLQTCYAMAEAVFAITSTKLGRPPRKVAVSQSELQNGRIAPSVDDSVEILSVGFPIDNVELKIDDGQVGEILVRGPFLFTGYHLRDSDGLFDEGWFRTGDIGFIVEDDIYVLGRKKEILIVYGKNFFAHDLENLVGVVDGVKPGRAVALGIYNDRLGSEEAVIIAEVTPEADKQLVRSRIKRVLSDVAGLVPGRVLLKESGWLVKSTAGKISRGENLRKLEREEAQQ